MLICGKCGLAYDDMKEKHDCPGPPDLTIPATMKDIQDIRLEISGFKSEILQMVAMLSRRMADANN